MTKYKNVNKIFKTRKKKETSADEKFYHIFRTWKVAGALLTWEREGTPQALTEGASVRSKPDHPLAPLEGIEQAGSGNSRCGREAQR